VPSLVELLVVNDRRDMAIETFGDVDDDFEASCLHTARFPNLKNVCLEGFFSKTLEPLAFGELAKSVIIRIANREDPQMFHFEWFLENAERKMKLILVAVMSLSIAVARSGDTGLRLVKVAN
jgi:hypothetical protein